MADPREFVLIGEFRDGISPSLAKINDQIASLKQSLANLGGKGARTASRDIGRFSAAVSSLTDNLKANNAQLRASIAPLKEYRKEIGKTVGAYKKLNEVGGNTRGLEATNKALREQVRLMNMLRARGSVMPGAQYVSPRRTRQKPRTVSPMPVERDYIPSPRKGGGGGGSPAGGMGAHMAEFGFAFTLGNAIAQPVQNAVVTGFQIGVGFMMKPFEFFANRLKERIEDEQSDIKAAGGIFSISRRQKDPFVKTMDEAMEFTQENNKRMAELAAALPGDTQQYIEVSKRISDSISRIVTSDKERAIQYANELRAERGATQLEGTGGKATRSAITELLGEMTKKTVLAGLGTGGGPGGVAGAYGLPQLTERMLTQQEVSMGQFQRYAAIFKDPLIMEALNRFIPKINASAAGTLERFQVMQKFYDEVLPPEMIRKFERSTAGILELFNTTIFGPETGLFGLGRKMAGMGKVMDDYGNYIKVFEDGTRKVVTSLEEASDANLSLFDMLRDSFANLGIALYPILSNLGAIFDPINKVAKLLVDFRHATGRFLNAFESYKKGFEDMLKNMSDLEKSKFLKIDLNLRASLAAINNFFANTGIIDESEFQKNAKQLMSTSFDFKAMMSGMLDTFLNSDVAENLGELIGEIVGTVLTEIAKVTGFLSGRVSSSNKLFEGIKKGFEDAGGPEAIGNIFKDVFKSLFKILVEVMKLIPFEGYVIIASMAVVPAAIQGLGMFIAEKVLAGIMRLKDVAKTSLAKSFSRAATAVEKGSPAAAAMAAAAGTKGKPGAAKSVAFRPVGVPPKGFEHVALPGKAPSVVGGVTGPSKAPSIPKPVKPLQRPEFGALSKLKGKGAGLIASGMIALSAQAPALAKAGKSVMAMAKSLPVLSIAFGALDFGLSKAAGEDTATAAGGAVGGVAGGMIGGAIGSAILPGIGTAIGGVLGTLLGDWIGSNIAPFFASLPAKLNSAWESLKVWFINLPVTLGYAVGQARANMEKAWSNFGKWWTSLGPKFDQLVQRFIDGAKSFMDKAVAFLSNPSSWGQLAMALVTGIRTAVVNAIKGIGGWFSGFGKGMEQGYRETTGGYQSTETQQRQAGGVSGLYNWGNRAEGGLGDAIASEMKHKPSGSDLLIANSSETVIPAAGGYGMVDFVDTLKWGFVTMVGAFKQAQQKQDSLLNGINQTLKTNQQQTNTRLAAMEKKFTTPGIAGGLGGAAAGGVDAFTSIAQKYGLQMTSGYRPGDPGWHGANRARDFSNGTGPTPQMMQFAQYLAATYGSNLKELIYTPLGFSIKNGQRVPPYAQGSHYNHVHVAYGLGAGNPAFFGSQSAAERWERSMVSGSVRVGSVTGNSAEGFGGGTVGDIYVTVNAGSTNDPDQLAYMVAERIQTAVSDAVNANILV